MPNWCDNALVAYGNKEEIDVLYQRMLSAQRMAAETHKWWTYCLFVEHGWNDDEIVCEHPVVDYVGGSLDEVNEPVQDGDDWIIRFWITTRWCPMTAGFKKIFSKYISIQFVFVAEEPGMCIYQNSDVKGRFFPDRFVIDDWENGCEYFSTIDEVIKYVKEKYGIDIDVASLDDDVCIYETEESENTRENHVYFHRFISENI